jgi:hypothetical protein
MNHQCNMLAAKADTAGCRMKRVAPRKIMPPSDSQQRPASRWGRFLALHRRELKVLAQIGCALCVVRGGLALFRLDRPNDKTYVFLVLGFFALYYCARAAASPLVKDDRDWVKVPIWTRRAFWPALTVCWAAIVTVGLPHMFIGWPSAATYHLVAYTAGSGFLALLYALVALFFAYGVLKGDEGGEHMGQDMPPM